MANIDDIRDLFLQYDSIESKMKTESIEYIREVLSKQDNQEIILSHREIGYKNNDVSVSIMCYIDSECMFDYVTVDRIRMISNRLFFDSRFRFDNELLDNKNGYDLAKVAITLKEWLKKNNKEQLPLSGIFMM
jgi:hypothetical protein